MRLTSLSITYYVGNKTDWGKPANFQYAHACFSDRTKRFVLRLDKPCTVELYRLYFKKKVPVLSVNQFNSRIREIRFRNI